MKKKKLNLKLIFKKDKISNLNQVKGGDDTIKSGLYSKGPGHCEDKPTFIGCDSMNTLCC